MTFSDWPVWSDWLNERVVDDAQFASAYDAVAPQRRALLKTCIARLFDWCGPGRALQSETTRLLRGGLQIQVSAKSLDFGVVLIDETLRSPARLLAAVMPVLAAGCPHVAVVRVAASDAAWPQPMLTGLELAGQELVADAAEVEVDQWLDRLSRERRSGAVVAFGDEIRLSHVRSPNIKVLRPRFTQRASIWMEVEETFDLDALAFMQPDVEFSVFGRQVDLPSDNFSFAGPSFDEFAEAVEDVAYMPHERMAELGALATLVLGKGQEASWVWPDLRPEEFQTRRATWTSEG